VNPSSSKDRITGVILARNEGFRIASALLSLRPWTDQLLVLNDESTDDTAEISREAGATVIPVRHTIQFDGLRNLAVGPAVGDWIFYLDADEWVPPALGESLRGLVRQRGREFDAVSIPRRNYYCGTWIRHLGWFPDHQTRLLRKGSFRYGERIHWGPVVDGRVLALPPDPDMSIMHFSARDVHEHVRKINEFTLAEADALLSDGSMPSWREMVGQFAAELQRLLDEGQAWREGTLGLVLAFDSAFGGFLRHAKVWDLRRQRGELADEEPVPRSAADIVRFMAQTAQTRTGPFSSPGRGGSPGDL
jgi:hypothetical protein